MDPNSFCRPFLFHKYIVSEEFIPFCHFDSDLEANGAAIAFLNHSVIEQLEITDGVFRNYLFVVDYQLRKFIHCIEFDHEGAGYSLEITPYVDIIDLDDNGVRWEGECANNMPCGWGCYYNAEGNLEYEGFRFGEKNICYGCYYHPDLHILEYAGSIHNGVRVGKGVLYGRQGEIVYDGYWLNGYPLQYEHSGQIHSFSAHVRLHPSDNCLPNVSVLRELKSLTISSCSCRHIRSLAIINASKLESIKIESFSFTSLLGESCLQSEDCTMILSRCPVLKEVTIEDQCFRGSKKCVISSMPLIASFCHVDNQSLKKLTIGSRCFLDCEICEFCCNPSLSKFYIDGMSFPFCLSVTVSGSSARND